MIIEIGKFTRSLSDIIKAFFYHYRTFGLTKAEHSSHATNAEIAYFERLGEMLNFSTEREARTPSSHRPADLVWVGKYEGNYYAPEQLVLHLERETRGWEKVGETLEKLFEGPSGEIIPMGIAIIDNVPQVKVKKIIEDFKNNFYSEKGRKKYSEFALLIYDREINEETKPKSKTITTNIFRLDSKEPEPIEAKFEYVGTCDGDEADFVIISY